MYSGFSKKNEKNMTDKDIIKIYKKYFHILCLI